MKNGENNQIDLLLRNLAQREVSASASAEGIGERDTAGGHLDADELNSFAEGVLAPATRSYYAAHLADCSRCRTIVIQLAQASGGRVRKGATEPSKSSWWSYLTSVFSPQVIRYGVPAISLAIFAAFGILWFQQRRQGDSVAQMTAPASTPEPGPAGAQQDGGARQQIKQDAISRTNAQSSGLATAKNAKDEEKPTDQSEVAINESTERGQQAAKPESDAKVVTAATPAARAADENTAFSPRPPKEVSEESKREELAKQREAPAAPSAAAQREDEQRERQDKDDAPGKKKSQALRRVEVGRVGTDPMGNYATATRAVAGRQFRRVNNTWVDTAYDSSKPTTNLTRGSEQYRALVADEPELHTIAQQLEGEVIVVWKSRAYRIR
jgi:hypothetical protein